MVCGKLACRPELDYCLKALGPRDTLVEWRLDRLGRNRTLGLETLMAIEVPMPPLVTQQTVDGMQPEVGAHKAKHTTIRQASAAPLPATPKRVFAGSQ
jgi:Resolvase, N terminal domain